MATGLEQRGGVLPVPAVPARGYRRPVGALLAVLAIGLAAYAAIVTISDDQAAELMRASVLMLWALAGASLAIRRPHEPVGLIVLAGAVVGAIGSVGAVRAPLTDGTARDLALALRWLSLAIIPAIGMHLVLGLPDGRLAKRKGRTRLISWYVVSASSGATLWLTAPEPGSGSWWPAAVLLALATVSLLIAGTGSTARYRRARGLERQRMQWFGWAVTVGAVIAVVIAAIRLLADVSIGALVPALATAPIPLALAFGASTRFVTRVDRLLAHTVSIAGLTGLVVITYVIVVVGLGEIPDESERTLLLLSMGAAATAALLYIPTRDRLQVLANRIVYGELHAPDEVLRTFGSRLSRAIPMDELLLQLAESLRKTFALDAVEIWTGQSGMYERSVSYPERGHAKMAIGPKEQPVFARAGVTGPAWLQVWLPQLLEGRDEQMVRAAPVVHSGELLGYIVVERRNPEEQLGEENERVLAELARQVALALHNVQLDSALQETLDEVRKQADELRASRERVVAAADAARRKIERDLHDGAQQNLVALAVKVKLLSALVERDPGTAKQMIDDLAGEVQEAVQALRDLAHGIYPPVLADRGLVPALESAANKAPLPTMVQPEGEIARYRQEVEAAVYFCVLEALNNAGKHAGDGSTATISLKQEDGVLLVEVADDGAGFDMASKGLGAGFTNMADRVGAVGGTLHVEAALGAGTKIAARIPVG